MDRILIILKKENGPRASSAPALGLNTIIFKHVYWYMQQTQVSRTIGPLVLIFDPIYVLSKNKKNIKSSLLKIFNFYNLKNLHILHGQVFVMKPHPPGIGIVTLTFHQ